MWIFILIIVYFIYVLIKDGHINKHHTDDNSELELLKTKLVEGEISEDEYLKKKKIIQN